jgi:predicted nucleic acid-binding protein
MLLLRRSALSDSSFFYAAVNRRDRYHTVVRRVLESAYKGGWILVTTTFVVAETHALILARLGRDIAAKWLEGVWHGVHVIRPTEEDERRACEIIFGYTDKDFSFTDAISFAVMGRLGITVALSLDEHFVQFGKFTVVPLQTEKLG